MTNCRRVVVTGVGIISPLGITLSDFGTKLWDKVSGIRKISKFDANRFSSSLAGEIDDDYIKFQDCSFLHEINRIDKFAQYALIASCSAINACDSRVNEACIFLGVGMGGLPNMERGVILLENKGTRKTSPYLIPSLIPNIAASMISSYHKIRGPQYTIAGACASGTQAIGQAMEAIRSGKCNMALTGGTESVITPITFSGFEAMRTLSKQNDITQAPRPFDKERDGMIVGEGAAIFILEEKGHAEKRKAHLYGELTGYATCSGSSQIALQSVEDSSRCVALALDDAGLKYSDIDCIYAQAAGLVRGDEIELEVLQQLSLKENRKNIITSIKGHIGHTFAASGPLNLAAALEALRRQSVSPTLNFTSADHKYSTLKIAEQTSKCNIKHCLINSFGFGGVNANLVISRI